jgi:hypothetical protein
MIVPGGGLSLDGWLACRPGFFLPVRVLSRLFRRLFLKMLADAHAAGRLAFFGDHAVLANAAAFAASLTPLRKAEWVVYAKKPFGGPQAVLAYLARYTHRVAIANSRLISADETGVTFKWKDYRIEGPGRYKTMTLPTHEFILMTPSPLPHDWPHTNRSRRHLTATVHPRGDRHLARPHTTNVAAQRTAGPPIAVLTGRTIAATTSIQTHQSRRRDQIPIVLAASPHIPHRDFVPWRFSVAGRFSAPILSSCRRPKTCTINEMPMI